MRSEVRINVSDNKVVLNQKVDCVREKKITSIKDIDEAITEAGFSYNPIQGIFYSNIDAWQRMMGYCRLYDEAMAPLNMIIDCEPIYFEYDNKKWLIEFWKGQYSLNTGCEIGIYTSTGSDLNIPGVFNGTFYNCASNDDMLQMSFILRKNGETLFKRRGRHWWLTGFKLGEFSEPSELQMYLSITFKGEKMLNSFIEGFKNAGYWKSELIIIENATVVLVFDKPRTPQPLTRVEETDWIIQRKNEVICKRYREITEPYVNFEDKVKAIQKEAPELIEQIESIGKNKSLSEAFKKIKVYVK